MATLGFSEIFEKVSKEPTEEKQLEVLRNYDSRQLRMLFQYAFDKRVVWLLPEGKPPYNPCPFLDQEAKSIKEVDKLYYYVKGGADNLRQFKRENLFVQLLESLSPKDAELFCAVKDRNINYPLITPKFVKKAFPTLDLIFDDNYKTPEIKEEVKPIKVEVSKKKGGLTKEWWDTPKGQAAREKLRRNHAERKAAKNG